MRISTPIFHPVPHAPVRDFPSLPVLLNDALDFDLPPSLRLPPQQLEFIDPEQEANDTFVRGQHSQPVTPRLFDNSFSADAGGQKMPHSALVSAAATGPKADSNAASRGKKGKEKSFTPMALYRQKIAPLLRQRERHKETDKARYPQEVKKLFRQAAQENPDMPTKHLAESLGLPPAVTYYWLGYRNPRRSAKKTAPTAKPSLTRGDGVRPVYCAFVRTENRKSARLLARLASAPKPPDLN